MKNKWFQVFFIFSILLLIVGCQAKEGTQEKDLQGTQDGESSFQVTVTDINGNKITLDKKPERIISLIPSNTEIAFSLGLGEKIIAVTENDTYPEEVKSKDIIGGFQLNFEKIISLNPDLVLAHGLNGDIEQLQNAGLNVIVVNNFESTFEDVYASIHLIAKATGKEQAGTEIISDMKERIELIRKQAENVKNKKTVWVEIDSSLYTTGQGTFLNEMLLMIQAKNIAGNEQGWPQFSEETIVNSNPDIIIATYTGAIESIVNRSAWSNINAVKNNQMFEVNADLFSRAGPRLIEGVEKLAALIYPETFSK
jgi:iron complex transport system substrate-binding protein